MESAVAKEAKASAAVLVIGTANPKNCYYQEDYPDFLFKVTNSEHKTELKKKFKRICEKSMVKKRYLEVTEESLKANPNICTYNAPSLDARQDMLIHEVPKLGKEAALKAIKEWGQPISSITHLVFCTTSCIDTPSADFQLVKLLGLNLSVNRFIIYQQGCFAGGTVLRIAKDVAENNADARVLIVCCEITSSFFHQPTEADHSVLVRQALFSDGAAAAIIGANPDPKTECPLFNLMSAQQTVIPNSEHGVEIHVRENGVTYYLALEIPDLVCGKIRDCLSKGFEVNQVIDGVNGEWNSLFYIVHPGGPRILNKVEAELGLKEGKLRATRHVLSEFGNMGGPSMLYIVDEMRKKSMEEGKSKTGEGLEWGVLFGIGPALTVETVVLRSVATGN